MRISELNQRIEVCKKIADDGPIENLESRYEGLFTLWAKKTALLGKESIALGLEHNTIQVNFVCRARSDIHENLFIKHNNIIYNIIGLNELKDNNNFMLVATMRKQESV